MLGRIYVWICREFFNKAHRLLIDIGTLGFASYFTFSKGFGFSLGSWASKYFQPQLISHLTSISLIVGVYFIIAKIALLIIDAFPASKIKLSEPSGLNHCCLRINHEITRHMASIEEDPGSAPIKFKAEHKFDINVALVVESLVGHVVSTLTGARARDIFVSIYMVPNFQDLRAPRESLAYITHYDPRKDWVSSRSINFNDGAHKNYECVKCIKSNDVTIILHDCKKYHHSASKRHKTLHHYVGMKLCYNESLLGFMNIEFHNKNFFASEEEMSQYIEDNIVVFRYLMEYQFLKKAFFNVVTDKLLK